MQKTSNGYIQLHKKICNAVVVAIIVRLADEWKISCPDAAFRLLNEAAMRSERHRVEIERIRQQNVAAETS